MRWCLGRQEGFIWGKGLVFFLFRLSAMNSAAPSRA